MITRRRFVQLSSATAATLLPSRRVAAAPDVPTQPTKLQQLDYSDVQLLDGPMRRQFDENHAFFLALDNDRLLKPFRQAANLPAPGDDMGGWYSWSTVYEPGKGLDGFVPAHSFGQYLSALARAYAITGDRATRQKVQDLVAGYAPAVSPAFYADYNLPCYTFDKVAVGLIDAHQFAQCSNAFPALDATVDAALPSFPPHALKRGVFPPRPHRNVSYSWDESYTLPENLYLAYRRGAGDRYHHLAQQYLQDDDYFAPLARGENPAVHDHAYSHVNALSSAMQAWLTDGTEMHLTAARNGLALLQAQSFATGGWGPNELIVLPDSNELADSLKKTHAGFETPCGAYAHLKLTRYLLTVTADPAYGDSMETVLYNTVLGALPLTPEGHAFYYSDYNRDGVKSYHPDKWPCCSGTLPQVAADYHISTAYRTPRGLAINLYTPSRIRFTANGAKCTLTQLTTYPDTTAVALTLTADRHAPFTLDLRIPAWSGPQTRIAVNGRALPQTPTPGTWFSIHRTWRSGDRIELEFDMPLRLVPLDTQHADLVALMRGPQTLFAILPTATESLTRAQLLAAQPVSRSSEDWTVQTDSGAITFRPFTAIRREHYRLYHQLA